MTPARRVLAEKRRFIWPIAIAFVINIALFVLLVYPLSQKVAGGERQAAESAAALAAARRDHADAKATVEGKQQADAELEKFYNDILPPDLSGARRMTYLLIPQLAEKSGLRVQDRQNDEQEIRDSALSKLVHSVALSGDYRDIRRFIHALETASDFLVLENVELAQLEGGTRGLDMRVRIATYYRAGGHGDN